MIRRLALLLALSAPAAAQTVPPHVRGVTDAFTAAGAIADATRREAEVARLWDALRAAGRIPYTHADTALFLFRGSASSVAVAGDLTGWRPSIALVRAGAASVWMQTTTLPEAARVDYKYVLNGSQWVLDPANPHAQWSGFGPNSELRMPAWTVPAETLQRPTLARGVLGAPVTLQSVRYGAPVVYRVWTPPGYETRTGLPVLYVTDGHEYADPALGTLPTVLDNLIADGRIEAPVVVFVDPRWQGTNRRQQQYVQNPGFAAFVAEELVPAIDAAYRTRPDREARVVLGTSLGGVFSLYLGLQHPTVFGKLAIQSPAFWVSESAQYWTGPSLYSAVQSAPEGLFTVAITTGTIYDTADEARRMRDGMLARGHRVVAYREVPEGHSWGNWRALYDEMLPALLPPAPVASEPAPGGAALRLTARPNPARGTAEIVLDAAAAGTVTVVCYDALGRAVATLHRGAMAAGTHAHRLAAPAAGTYTCRAAQGAQAATAEVTFVR